MPNPILLSSLFGALTQNVQARIDAASELNKRIFDNVIYAKYLDWDVPTIGLDFEEIIGKYNLTVAASTIGDNAKEPILGSYGLDTVKEKVLNHAITLPMSIQDYRKVLQILDSKSISDEQKKKQLIDLMWGNVKRVVNGVEAKLDIIFLGALSNCGVFNFNNENNPEGGVRGEINYNMPASNIASSVKEWTEGNLDTVDCMEDIQAILDVAEDRTVLGKILCAPSVISYMCRSKKMKQMIWGTKRTKIRKSYSIAETYIMLFLSMVTNQYQTTIKATGITVLITVFRRLYTVKEMTWKIPLCKCTKKQLKAYSRTLFTSGCLFL